MLKQYHQLVGGVFRILDAILIGIAWIASYWLRFYFPLIEVTKGFPEFSSYAALSPLVMVIWAFTLLSFGAYRSKRMLRRTQEAHLILRAHAFALLVFISITYLFSEYRYSRAVMVYFGTLGGISLVGSRLILRNLLRSWRRKGYNLRHVVAAGEGPVLESLIQRIGRFPELGLNVLGVIVDERSPLSEVAGKPVLGRFGELREVLQKNRADQLWISLPRNQSQELDRILRLIQDETLTLKLIPDIQDYIALGCEIEDFDGMPVVNLNHSPLEGWGTFAKRLTDLILSAFALTALSPVFLLIAIAVKLGSKGPVFYRQERMGLDGKTFQMIKFRSMGANAEQQTGAVWAVADDPRRTRLGTFLRATSLDELPQLWNVLKGEMSLVGPRPERPVFVHKFKEEIPHYMLRHKVKSGLTGWAQVNGWRGNTSLDRRIECDLYYIRNWSYGLDLKILVLTVWKGFIHKNAY